MAEVRPEIVLDGDISPLRQKLREATADLKRFGTDGENAISRMVGPLGALQSKFMAVGAILAGGAVFKAAVQESAKFTEESINLGRALGTNTTLASTYVHALQDIGVEVSTFASTAQMLGKRLVEDEDSMNKLGLVTRDASGALRPLNELTTDAIGILQDFKAGADRSGAANVFFGRGFDTNSRLIELNTETLAANAAMQKDLGTLVSAESAGAFEEYRSSMDGVEFTLKALQMTIGNALMPVLAKLGNWFAAIGPAAVVGIRGAIGGLAATFHLVTTGVTVLWETLNAMVVSVAEPIRALGAAIGRALVGDFEGAAAEVAGIGPTISTAWGKAFDEMAASAQGTRDKIWNLFAEGTPAGAAPDGGRDFTDPKGKKEKKEADPSLMAAYEARLAEIKNVYEQENALRQFSKEQELAYWRELQQSAQVGAKDRLTIAKRTAQLELEIRRQSLKEDRDLNAVAIESRRAAALAKVQAEQQAAGFQRTNGEITKRQLLTLEEQFARQRFEIEYQSLLERLELAKNDPNNSPAELARIKEQMLEVERNYQAQRAGLGQEKKEEGGNSEAMFSGIGNAFGTAANAMLTRATTLRQQLANVWQSIYQSFVQNMIVKPLADWIASQAKMLAVKLGFMTEEQVATKTAAAVTTGIKATETTAVVGENAVQAGTGAASALSSIPFAGPVLALAAMAAIYAAVMGMRGKKSAARGYDIPKGLNPMVQTHEEEMILPQKYANVIRGLAVPDAQSGGGGGGFVFAPTIKTHDSRDMLRALQDGGVLRKAMEELQRNFVKR